MPASNAAVASVAALGIALIVLFALQLLTSTRSAHRHLANGTALTPQSAAPTVAESPVERFTAAAHPSVDTTAGDVASQQIFAQLNEYYAANISQGNAIFWASLLSMSIGFTIVFVGIVTAAGNPTTAIVAGIAGVLSQFIAATFLVALRSTQQQATTYAQTLVELRLRDVRTAAQARSTTLGLQLLNEITTTGSSALADQTRATLAMGLIVGEAATMPLAPPVATAPGGDDDGRVATRLDERAKVKSVTFDDGRATTNSPV